MVNIALYLQMSLAPVLFKYIQVLLIQQFGNLSFSHPQTRLYSTFPTPPPRVHIAGVVSP